MVVVDANFVVGISAALGDILNVVAVLRSSGRHFSREKMGETFFNGMVSWSGSSGRT